MASFSHPTPEEIAALDALGNAAEAWSQIRGTEDFRPHLLLQARLEGIVEIGPGARGIRSRGSNYRSGEGSLVEGVTALECRSRSSFGNGVPVATMNECGGRTVKIFDTMAAQIAYLMAVYRHRPQAIAALERMIDAHAENRTSEKAEVGRNCRIVGARFIREVRIGDNVTVDGASMLCNGTLCDGVRIGVDVKAYDFIAAEGARIDNGATVERCFVGENCRLDKGFSAAESLFFANSHCENGEAASIFAGPYTVSHHKSSLLIAGMFSFFNAGSGANQSNHLFKSGAVHQSVHLRGCKFGSSTYIMAPAIEGPFTLVLGRHTQHHDTSAFPFSYLVEQDGRSALMPGANLTSYGTVRDIGKWLVRERRTVIRVRINFDEDNPYLAGGMIDAVNTLNSLAEAHPDAESYVHNHALIRSTQLQRGLKLYNKAIVASLGAMLRNGEPGRADGTGRWNDVAGQYVPRREVKRILDAIANGGIDSLEGIDRAFDRIAADYDHYARSWAEGVLAQLLGHAPSPEEIAEAVTAGERTRETLRKSAEDDRARDCSPAMAVGYGVDADSEEEKMQDYHTVRGIR